MTQIDIILIGASGISAVVFLILGPSKLIKFYIGLLIGLLLCILINLKLNQITTVGVTDNFLNTFFSNNKEMIGSISLGAIPFMGFLFLLNRSFIIRESEGASSLGTSLGNFLMGLTLVPLTLGMYSIIDSLGLSSNNMLSEIMTGLKNSALLQMFSNLGHYLFLLLLGILLYKFVLKFLFLILIHFFNKIGDLRDEEREIRRREAGEEDEDDSENHNKH